MNNKLPFREVDNVNPPAPSGPRPPPPPAPPWIDKRHPDQKDHVKVLVENDWHEIVRNLYVGSLQKNIKDFKYVVNVMYHRAHELRQPNDDSKYDRSKDVFRYYPQPGQVMLYVPFLDEPELPDIELLDYVVGQAADFVKKGPTLIHCRGGVNRSGMVAALVLIKLGYSAEGAVALLKEKRGQFMLRNEVFKKHVLSKGNK